MHANSRKNVSSKQTHISLTVQKKQILSRCCCAQLVQKLVQEVEAISETMLAGLLDRLRSSIQLPECLRVVGYLRRLAPFPEAKLRQMYATHSPLVLAQEAFYEMNGKHFLKCVGSTRNP